MKKLDNIQYQYDNIEKFTTSYEDTYGEMTEDDVNWHNECTREHIELKKDLENERN